MNYLAHAYLSFNDDEILTGNIISDFVKGKQKLNFSEGIQKGIALHRAIDRYTDEHEATRAAKEFFRPAYRLYSGAFIDIVYDHFLAADEREFPGNSLFDFSQETYRKLDGFNNIFPVTFAAMFPYMKKHNWLFNYRSQSGIERSFEGLVRRSAYLTDSSAAAELLRKNYDALRTAYNDFFPSVKQFAYNLYTELKR